MYDFNNFALIKMPIIKHPNEINSNSLSSVSLLEMIWIEYEYSSIKLWIDPMGSYAKVLMSTSVVIEIAGQSARIHFTLCFVHSAKADNKVKVNFERDRRLKFGYNA